MRRTLLQAKEIQYHLHAIFVYEAGTCLNCDCELVESQGVAVAGWVLCDSSTTYESRNLRIAESSATPFFSVCDSF